MPVPLLDVNAQNHAIQTELREAFEGVLGHGRFILGPEHDEFEREMGAFVGARHALAVSSGTDALLLGLMALGVGAGDEVLCPAFTFFATAGVVARLGATPVFVDVCPGCFNVDVADARAKVTERTKVIIPVHLFGQCADMDGVLELARERGLRVLEDAAQSLGASQRGRQCGTLGDCGAYSFFPSKNLGGFGDGGMLVTNDDALAEQARVLRVHGSKPKYYHHYVGGNFRLDTLQCALLGVKLKRYEGYTAGRRRNAEHYTRELVKLPGVRLAGGAPCGGAETEAEGARLILPVAVEGNTHIWNQYTLRVVGAGRRDGLREHLQRAGVGCEIYYPLTLDQQPCFAGLPEGARAGCGVAHQLAGEVLSIPIYAELTEAQREEVIRAIREWLEA